MTSSANVKLSNPNDIPMRFAPAGTLRAVQPSCQIAAPRKTTYLGWIMSEVNHPNLEEKQHLHTALNPDSAAAIVGSMIFVKKRRQKQMKTDLG